MELPSTQRPTVPGPGGSQEQGGETVAPIRPWLILSSCVALGAFTALPVTGLPSSLPDDASRAAGGLDAGQHCYRLLSHVLGEGTQLQFCTLGIDQHLALSAASFLC